MQKYIGVFIPEQPGYKAGTINFFQRTDIRRRNINFILQLTFQPITILHGRNLRRIMVRQKTVKKLDGLDLKQTTVRAVL